MTFVTVAFLMALLPAAQAVAKDTPEIAARYDAAYEKIREKGKKAYLAPAPIDEAVTKAELQALEPQDGQEAPYERKRKTADLVEALKAVKSLQGAPDQPVLSPAEKTKLMRLVTARLGLTGEDISKAVGTYLPSVMAPAPFALAPPESVLKEAKARQDASAARTSKVMGDAAHFRDGRSVEGGIPAAGAGYSAPRDPGDTLRKSDFQARIKTGPAIDVPLAGGEQAKPDAPAGEHKPGILAKVVGVTRTALPGTSGWKESVGKFTKQRMIDSEMDEEAGAKLLEKGGFGNTVEAAGLSVRAFGSRVMALDPRTYKQIGVGVGAAAGATVAVIAAPVAGPVAAVALAANVGFTAWTAYTATSAVADIVREPNYANAAGLALTAAGAKYAGPLGNKAAELGEKAFVFVAKQSGAKIAAEGTAIAGGAIATTATATPLLAKVAATETVVVAEAVVAKAVVKETVALAESAAAHAAPKVAGHIAKESTVEFTKEALEATAHKVSIAADQSAPRPIQMVNGQPRGPFNAALPMAAAGR